MGTILLFNVNKAKKKKIELLAFKLGHSVKLIEKKDFEKPIGRLLGIPVAGACDGMTLEIDDEMMVLSGFDGDALDLFFDVYKEMGLENIKNKAVVTESNISWSAERLYMELCEHAK